MPNVLIRNVPEDTHARLLRRAEGHGQSLQQYLITELRRLADRPTISEVLDRVNRRGSVGFERAVSDLAEGRAEA